MTGMPEPPRVVAVIPAYDPGAALLDLIDDVSPQVEAVVVVDDGSRCGLDVLGEARSHGAWVIRQANGGIAAALNTGLTCADDLGADAVLTLDQDSRLPGDYVTRAVAAWQAAVTAGIPVGLVAAASYSGHPTPTAGRRGGFDIAFDPMQSGQLVPMATFAQVGGFDESLVIDGVDSELTVRCREHGLLPIVGPGCDLQHGQGERVAGSIAGRPLTWGGRPLMVNRHSPARVYSMSRNGVILTRRHLRTQPRWVLRRLAEEAKAHTLRLALSPDRAALARAAARGMRDGLAGRTGPSSQPR